MSATITATATATANGLKLLEACNYDNRLCGAIIATRKDWPELLDSIPTPNLRKHVASVVWGIREALRLDAAYALDICQGRE